MDALVESRVSFNDITMLKLAREIAMDILPLEQVLTAHQIDSNEWETISKTPRFQDLLRSEVEAWQSAANTADRVKLKSLAFVEEALPEFYARAHDPRENLTAKVEVLKTVARFAGVGASNFDAGVTGEKFSVTINLGADQQLKIEKEIPSKVIEHEA